MKQIYNLVFVGVFCCLTTFAQQGTEVYLANLDLNNDSLKINGEINLSQNEGYDNQPSFFSDNKILFSSTRKRQTDIALYDLIDKTTTWLSNTPNGSEYSPLKIPGRDAVSAVRLDEDGLQRLYEYDLKTGDSKVLIPNLKVGYHVWYSNDIIVCTVLIENRMDLVVYNLKENTNYTVQKNVGRSLHKIPNSELISFIAKVGENATITSLNPYSKEKKNITTLLGDSEDVTWTTDGSLITAYNKYLFSFKPSIDTEWKSLFEFQQTDIHGISRLAVSPNGKFISFVSKDAPYKIVQKQVETFNARDLEAFANCYSEEVLVKNFSKDTISVGREQLKEGYDAFYKRTPAVEVKVSSRIVINSTVIDQEFVSIGDKQKQQVAIYETDGLIKTMTFIRDKKTTFDPEVIVQKQLDAYNSRDIDGFLATYSTQAKILSYSGELRSDGTDAMRAGYTDFFNSAPDLHCEIINRIVIGNKVIDEESITANGNTFKAVAIYEVENNEIVKVTFVN
ncbi:nuclear transport factor 2 family protein [Maribacter sp. 1_MG-2023]|uniref:nuclear transport factor 2 family protein n=1 Tax=Maribacter sp. 1_MG-2023 TaxID=3062677 RepID=UPI0026E366EE|nr:nuclear transport factor 2 family protein [Maribacter sp. 1_MG-2023]MDO6472431.1 nuclear transport factor 2 family protein [Maribacter sp. 1_MG-2023]